MAVEDKISIESGYKGARVRIGRGGGWRIEEKNLTDCD